MSVAVGDQRRRREAMDLLVAEIAKSGDLERDRDNDNITHAIRIAIEVHTAFV